MLQTFPVTYSTMSVKALASEVLPQYGLGEIVECKLYFINVNDTYQVKTAQAGTYYLRIYRTGYRSLEEVAYELRVLNHLHRKGVTVAYPLPARDGSLIRELPAPEGKRCAVLFTAAPGVEPSYDQDAETMSHKYGQCVAHIHNALQDFSDPRSRSSADFENLIETPLVNIQPVLSRRPEDWAYLQFFAKTLRQRILDLPASALEQGVCHGDLQGTHAHIDQDGRLTFFDFDFCGFGYRAFDLAVFRWFARLKEKEQAWWEPYLRGYREERPVSELDLKAVPLFICARHIWHMGLHTGNAHDWGYGPSDDAYFDKRMRWLRELESDYLKK